MKILSNELLIDVYKQALKHKLDEAFISLLKDEMRKRKLNVMPIAVGQ